uniref:glutathione transferase n=1 Tax=Panagrolaimus superbus TaxID=310955 RepID=A0A914YDQ5_9BILA
MVHYKLTYFNIRGLGEPIRIMFRYADVKFEDNRISRSEWPKIKPTTPTGKMPILEVDNKTLVESGAIYRYLGDKFNLRPKCEWDNAQMESAVEFYNDFRDEIRPYFRLMAGLTTEGEKDKLYQEIFIPASNRVFKRYNEIIATSKSGFLADEGFSWGDTVIAEKIVSLKNMDSNFVKRFPEIVDYQERVHNIEKIRDYIKGRKFSII